MAWFKKARTPIAAKKAKESRVPEGLWVKCPGCAQVIYNKDLTANLNVCPKCAHHFRVTAAERLKMLVDGEKIARGIERALERRCPMIIVCCSGGARMMEGPLSLMQMAKICGALAQLDAAGVPYVSVLTDPTTGGVTASFAMLGDLNIA